MDTDRVLSAGTDSLLLHSLYSFLLCCTLGVYTTIYTSLRLV